MPASKEFGVSEVAESLATGLFLVGFGVGALVAGPISETIGRSPVYIDDHHGIWLGAEYRVTAYLPIHRWLLCGNSSCMRWRFDIGSFQSDGTRVCLPNIRQCSLHVEIRNHTFPYSYVYLT